MKRKFSRGISLESPFSFFVEISLLVQYNQLAESIRFFLWWLVQQVTGCERKLKAVFGLVIFITHISISITCHPKIVGPTSARVVWFDSHHSLLNILRMSSEN